MNKQSWLLNLSLLKTHPAFRAVFLARFISIVSLGLLGVAVPVQIQMMTHSTWQVGLSVTLTGGAMFVGLMVGGVLADRYERKRVILLARGTCGIGFIGLCLMHCCRSRHCWQSIYLVYGMVFSHRLALRRYWRRHQHW